MIRLRELTKRYPNTLALDSVSLDFEPGEVVAVLGPNGSGKSTMLKCIAGLITPTSGTVEVEGSTPIHHQKQAQRNVSYLPQHPELPTRMTVLEAVEFYRRMRDLPAERTEWALDAVKMGHARDKRVNQLSGGMDQRIALAIALMPRPDYLLLDEPTARLDPEAHGLLFDRLREHSRGETERAVIYATHILSDVVEFADRVIFLRGGVVAADLTREQLDDRLAELEELQLRIEGEDGRAEEIAREVGARRVRSNGSGIRVRIEQGSRSRLVRELEERGVEVTGLDTKGGELEELYREFAGREEEE